jgi:hypothetical protein
MNGCWKNRDVLLVSPDTPYLSATMASREFLPVQEWMPDNAGHILQNWLTLN